MLSYGEFAYLTSKRIKYGSYSCDLSQEHLLEQALFVQLWCLCIAGGI